MTNAYAGWILTPYTISSQIFIAMKLVIIVELKYPCYIYIYIYIIFISWLRQTTVIHVILPKLSELKSVRPSENDKIPEDDPRFSLRIFSSLQSEWFLFHLFVTCVDIIIALKETSVCTMCRHNCCTKTNVSLHHVST